VVLASNRIYYSPVSEIELLSARHLTGKERVQIKTFLLHCERVDVTQAVIDGAIELRLRHGLKVPDGIIAASAIHQQVFSGFCRYVLC
jgi:hypothetical protein